MVSYFLSDFHLRAELHHPVWWDPEELGCRPRVSRHENEKPLAPGGERLGTGGKKIFAATVVSRFAWFRYDAALGGEGENLGHVGRLHETVFRLDATEV